jgi:hypothetical protein
MKVKWGALMTDGRGKIGGQVASKNRSGAYMRNKVTPSNPQTSAQMAVRSTLASFSSGWRGLSQAARDAWNGAVSAFSRTNIFGDIVQPTGKNLYTRLNANLTNIGAATIGLPPVPVEVVEPTVSFDTNTATPTDLQLQVDNLSNDQDYLILATPPTSAGKSFVKSEYRIIGVMPGNAAQPHNVSVDYISKFGDTVAGQKLFVKVVPVVTLTGQNGVGSSASDITA